MCYFVTIALPRSVLKKTKLPGQRGLHLLDAPNPSLLAALPPEQALYIVTSSGCSCSLCHEENPKTTPQPITLRADATEYLQMLAKTFGAFHLFIHWYSGIVTTETLRPLLAKPVRADRIASTQLLADYLTLISPD